MIRKMQIADYSDVYNLWLANKGMGLNDVDDSESGIVRFLDRNPDTCFVAERDGRLVGVIMAGNDGRRGFIYHTAVHPDYHRQGIGSALVSAALETLRSVGITKVALVVFERNQRRQRLLGKARFYGQERPYLPQQSPCGNGTKGYLK